MPVKNKSDKKKIIFIVMTSSFGGAERQALYYSEHLILKRECNVEWWNMLPFDKELEAPLKKLNIKTRRIFYPGSNSWLLLWIKSYVLISLFRLANPDFLLPYLLLPNVFINLIWKHTGAKGCFWNQRDEGIQNFFNDKKLIKSAVENTCAGITNSAGGSKYLQNLGMNPDKIRVVKNGINATPNLQHLTNDKFDLNSHDFICTMVANIHSNKDHNTLVKAWKKVVDEILKEKKRPLLVLVGKKYEEYMELEILINELKLNDYIICPGFSNRINDYLAQTDVYVHSSLSEGTSNSIIEAMIKQKPIVATAIPSIINTVSVNNLSFLCEPLNDLDMAEKILTLYRKPDLRNQLGNSNFDFARQEYSMDNMCYQMDEIVFSKVY